MRVRVKKIPVRAAVCEKERERERERKRAKVCVCLSLCVCAGEFKFVCVSYPFTYICKASNLPCHDFLPR